MRSLLKHITKVHAAMSTYFEKIGKYVLMSPENNYVLERADRACFPNDSSKNLKTSYP